MYKPKNNTTQAEKMAGRSGRFSRVGEGVVFYLPSANFGHFPRRAYAWRWEI